MLGTVGSGKTTVTGLITLTAITMSAYLQEQFKCDVIESASGILFAQSELRKGRFPPKTQWNEPVLYESGLLMQWDSRFRKREMHLPICDVAGEVVADLVSKYREGMYDLEDRTMRETKFLVDQIKDRDGYILTVPAPRANLFVDKETKESVPMEKETALRQDPDVNLSSILEAVISYKRKHKAHPIQGIAVVVTKYDMVKDICEAEQMDLYDESGVGFRNFMNTCFPATANKLRFFGLENVAFFPSEVGLYEEPWDDGKPRIKIINRRDDKDETPCRVPEYPEQQYVRLINYLKEFAA